MNKEMIENLWFRARESKQMDDIIMNFAESIVKKCADVCVGVGDEEWEEPTGNMYADAIKKHFGVE